MNFEALHLSTELLKALQKNKYQKATPIQEKAIPLILNGADIMARAQTGSGKTASFVLPLLDMWQKKESRKKAKITLLILAPTRELTIQISNTITNLSENFISKPKVATKLK